MRILGVDYGRRKVGLAISEGPLPRPLMVIRGGKEEMLQKIQDIIIKFEIERIIVGLSEGDISIEQKVFASALSDMSNLPVEMEDETLTTKDAQSLSIQAKIPRAKRRKMEDAYSACLILENYLERA